MYPTATRHARPWNTPLASTREYIEPTPAVSVSKHEVVLHTIVHPIFRDINNWQVVLQEDGFVRLAARDSIEWEGMRAVEQILGCEEENEFPTLTMMRCPSIRFGQYRGGIYQNQGVEIATLGEFASSHAVQRYSFHHWFVFL
jgi:hypothetical protein